MSVAARCSRAALGSQLDPAEHEHGGSGRDAAGNERELSRELVSRDGNPQAGTHHYF